MITAGQLDLMIDNQQLDSAIFEQKRLKEEQLLLAVPAAFSCNQGLETYRLSEKDIICGNHISQCHRAAPLEHFRDIPFISMTRENETRHRSDEIFKEAGIKPKTILEIDRLVTLYSFVEMGTAASIVSDTLVQNLQYHNGKVVFYRLESKFAHREIYMSWKRNKHYSKAMEAFVQLMQEQV